MAKAQEPAISEGRKLDIDVMDAMQGNMPSQKGNISPIEIYKKYFQSISPKLNTDVLLAYTGALLKNPKRSLIQIGNTIFNVYRVSPTEVEFHMVTSEHPRKILENSIGFVKFLKNQKIKTAKTIVENPETMKLIKQVANKTGIELNIGQSTEKLDDVMKPVYTVEVTL